MKYILGLDVGIGSVGWAVVRNDTIKRIENFGVRIFASGEDPKTSKRESQKRRAYRSSRRLFRRRSHRKWRIKAHFENIGLCKVKDIESYFETASPNIIELRTKAIDEQVTPEELAACLINICNRRGYKAFYEQNTDGMSKEELKEFEEDNKAISTTLNIMQRGGYRTVAEMILRDNFFNIEGSEFKKYRNNSYDCDKILFTREMLCDEVKLILSKQKEFYPQLNQNNIDFIIDAIFSQRDFEDGPGDPDDKYRQYKGFLDTLGNCSFYKEEKRGSRFTLLADIYSLVNALSQYIYVDSTTGEIGLTPDLADELLSFALSEGKINVTSIKKIAKKHGKEIRSDCDADIGKCLTFTKAIKDDFISSGYDWSDIASDYINENSLINRIGIFLSENITPKRRKEKIVKEFPELNERIIEKLVTQKPKGTTNACFKFMRESIEAFLRGESYGSFQAKINKELELSGDSHKCYKILPPFKSDYEFYDNPVVFRSINETRKIINAVVRKYGSPYAINIEVGSELNKSLENRKKESSNQKKNERLNDNACFAVANLLGIKETEVTPSQIERYKLGEEQKWKCLYSGRHIDEKEALLNKNHTFEVDHIIPFSLILDNTLSNKALVYFTENQTKGQRTPLMYLNPEAASAFIGRVNELYGKKKEFRRKYQYLMQKSFDNELLKEWKSRNLNDTRYISKFLVNYLRNTLEFERCDEEKYQRQTVYAVKSSITSRMRRQWLNEATWGNRNKADLKRLTCLDHATDAIVIANCIPAYVEMAALNQRLKDIYYSAGKTENKEYVSVFTAAVENLYKYFGIPKNVSERQLRYKKNTPSLIPHLRDEVDIRLCDCFMQRYFIAEAEKKKSATEAEARIDSSAEQTDSKKKETPKLPSDEEIAKNFRKRVAEFYSYDPDFAVNVRMPHFSLKQDKKVNKQMFADNPISIKTVDGVDYQITSKSVLALKKKEISSIHTNDSKLIKALSDIMMGYNDEKTVREAINDRGETTFVYNGRQLNKVKLKKEAPKRYFVKEISDDNRTVLDNTNYYCLEIYKTAKGKTGVCAVAYSDLVNEKGKLYLCADYKYPEDYSEHQLYVFPGDYIRIIKGEDIIEGYYKGIKTISRGQIYITEGNNSESSVQSITQKSEIQIISIDILGNKGGVVKCGEPLSLIPEKN